MEYVMPRLQRGNKALLALDDVRLAKESPRSHDGPTSPTVSRCHFETLLMVPTQNLEAKKKKKEKSLSLS